MAPSSGEYPHLARRPQYRILISHRPELDLVSEPLGDGTRPRRELRSAPFEAVVLVAEPAGGQRRPVRVVLGVRRRDDRRLRPGELEQRTLKRGEARRV